MKEYVSWEEVDTFINSVVQHYKDKQFTGVYGPARGGLVFAVMLSHLLNIPMLMSPVKGCLIVDDIADTGDTLLKYKGNSDYCIATMHYHKQSKIVPDFWLYEKKDEWVVYPWEARYDSI